MDHPILLSDSSLMKARLHAPRGLHAALKQASHFLLLIPRESLSPAAQWIEDHSRFLLEEEENLRRMLRHSPRLPAMEKTPRILLWARRVIEESGGDLSPALILHTARSFFSQQEITQREIALLPAALSCALFEKMLPLLFSCRKEYRLRQEAKEYILHMEEASPLPSNPFLTQKILSLLSQEENSRQMKLFYSLLEKNGVHAETETKAALDQMTRLGQEAAGIIRSLHRLPRLPFDRIAERLSPAAAILREEDTYRRMDADSRNYYLLQVERIAKRLHVQESAVARAALSLAREQKDEKGEAGYYLLERSDLIAAFLLKKKPKKYSEKRRERLFVLPLYLGAAGTAFLCRLFHAPWYLWLPLLLVSSEILRIFYYRFLSRRFPPRMLPRLNIRRLTREKRTLIVVPTLLTSRKQALHMARQLSILRLAHPDPFLDFMLLGDFSDASSETKEEDAFILESGKAAVEALNQSGKGGVYYLHRKRAWNGECFSGRERKRGALETLNELIVHGKTEDSFAFSSCDLSLLHRRYACVITLDADTYLPPGTALQLIGTMLHPLQKGRIAVIQPRMEVGSDTVRTLTQKLLGGAGGVDPYHLSAQNLYQDVFGKGSFVGKGVYDPFLFLARLEGRVPEGRLLSHDLYEGEAAGSAFADDIVLYDGHPAKLNGWYKRLHRWTRGDWQLFPFLFDKRFSLLSRHKMWDNLRRSLLPAAQMILLFAGALLNHPLLCLLGLPWPGRGMGLRLLLLPGKSLILLDGAFRALYRQFISHKGLLSWVTAAQAEGKGETPLFLLMIQLLSGAGLIFLSLLPQGFLPEAFIGLAWLISPLFAARLDAPIKNESFLPRHKEAVRALARDTWRFFEDHVTENTLFLPPDNVQKEPDKGAALRTSPTNMGLYLLSCCAARELGFITTAQMSLRMAQSVSSMEKLEKWQGHFYNWYDLTEGAPLSPAFISTVDSGNLAMCLICCAQFCRARLPEMPKEYLALPARLDELANAMDFSLLYDKNEKLFYIGMDALSGRPTPSHYDLLASEARLTSFFAIMKGQIPSSHWKKLNRTSVRAGGGPALLSWGGTMFEYLMPALLLPHLPGTLLGEGCRSAIRAQMAHHPGRPFGISESGYYAFDPDLNYQYRAFGLPGLALTGETAGNVIAPYASMLALPFFPRSAGENLLRMKNLGWMDEHGFFEAADYSPRRMETSPQLVMSHMAHHQGMILCAACNALTDQALVRTMMALPAARAHIHLLLEKAPRKARRRPDFPMPREEKEISLFPALPARKGFPPDSAILHGKGASWLLTANGQGYLAHQQMMITRFTGEAGQLSGPQFYVRDEETGEYLLPALTGSALFEAGSVQYSARINGLKLYLRCCISPLTGASIAMLQAENTTENDRKMEAVSFLEIAQSSLAADSAHPNFRDLSVKIESFGENALLSRRLPREENEEAPLILHAVSGDFSALRRQGDRMLFLGREGTYAHPEQMQKEADQCAFRIGDVIAPCLSLRARMHIPAKEKARLFFITAAGDEKALSALSLSPETAGSAFSLAAAREKMLFRFLHLDSRAAAAAHVIWGALSFYGLPHQSRFPSASRNSLWRFGISGNLPLLMIRIQKDADQILIRQILRIHAYLRMQGAWTDCVFFCPEEKEYLRPLHDLVQQLILSSPAREYQGAEGGVHLISGSEEEAREMASLARLSLEGHLPLNSQLSSLRLSAPECAFPHAANSIPASLPPLYLDNSFGGFTEEGAYAVYSPAPSPWHNLLCNDSFGTLVCETGILHSYAENSRLKRITRLSPDVHRAPPSEEIFLRDETGASFSLAACTAVHEPGITLYHTKAGCVNSELSVFTHAVLPLGARCLTLRSEKPQRIQISYAVRFAIGEHPEATRCHGNNDEMIFAQAGDIPGFAWAALEKRKGHALSSALLDTYSSLPSPNDSLPQGGNAAFFSASFTLHPHEPLSLIMALGFAPDEKNAKAQFAHLLAQGAGNALREVRAFFGKKLSSLTLFAGDAPLEWMMNRWLPCQALTARLMARMGPYQAGGAFGFRDQLQDLLILLHSDPEFARAHILRCAVHQFPEGDVQHWWHPPARGVRTRISDDKLFLPYITAQYIRITGDESILSEPLPYLDSPPLQNGEKDRYDCPKATSWKESLLLHCCRAIASVSLGSHNLPLMGDGDWNDGMNRVGGAGGESVWLGFFLALVLRDFAPFCPEKKEEYQALRRRVLAGCEEAWTGKWYLRAFYDGGEPLGGPDTDPPRIDLISQAFSVLAGASRTHARTALSYALQWLYDEENGLVKLLTPPFTPKENAGYIGAYIPGVRENGGQYTHAVPWLIMALCQLGEYAAAWKIARKILPFSHADTREKALKYKTEPYVLCGDVYAGQNAGRGGWSWYTGSAAWLYHTFLTVLLGFEKRGDQARLSPCPEPGMEEYTLIYRFGNASYHFTAAQSAAFPTLDGEKLQDGWVPLRSDGRTHEARFPLRNT